MDRMEKYVYELHMKVRDYECDLQGVVNNANYLHYLEYTRHEFLLAAGISFAELHKRGVDPFVARVNLAFKASLVSGDAFISRLRIRKERLKYIFYQDIYRASDNRLSVRAAVETVCTMGGRLCESEEFDKAFAPYIEKT